MGKIDTRRVTHVPMVFRSFDSDARILGTSLPELFAQAMCLDFLKLVLETKLALPRGIRTS